MASIKCDSKYSPKYRSDLQPPESLIWIKDGSRSIIECLTHCEADKICVAVSLNASSCLGYSSILVDREDPLVTKQNFVYTERDFENACTKNGFMSYPGHRLCLRYYNQTQTRTSAKETCRLAGGRLVRVDTREKHDFIKNFLQNDVAASLDVFIGGKALVKGVWEYDDGSAVQYTKWVPGKPDDNVMPSCLYLRRVSNFDIDDVSCGYRLHFICVKDIFY